MLMLRQLRPYLVGVGIGILLMDKMQERFTIVTMLALIMLGIMLFWVLWEGFETVID